MCVNTHFGQKDKANLAEVNNCLFHGMGTWVYYAILLFLESFQNKNFK